MSSLLVVIFGAAVAAFSVSALAGGGAGLILIPLLGLALQPVQVPAALSIGTAVSSASRLAVFRSSVRWEIVRWFVPAALPLVVLGAWSLTLMEPHYLRLGLGCFLIGNLIFAIRSRRSAPRTRPTSPSPAWLGLLGGLAGFTSGLTGAVGVLFNDVYLRWGLTKEEIVATRAANEVLLHVLKLGLYATFGLVDGATLAIGSLVATAALVASLGAKRVLSGLDETLFRRINHGAMAVAGAAMIISASTALAARHGVRVASRADEVGIEVGLQWRDGFVAVEWRNDGVVQLERSIDLAQLPLHLRPEIASFVRDADRVVIEKVSAIGRVNYEISAYRQDGKTKLRM